MYTPLQTALWPVVKRLPREVTMGQSVFTVFSANIVSYTRTLLVIPIALCLKYGFFCTSFALVLLHDFLDHVDGIVAKVHRSTRGPVDDPLVGGFIDAFCDKIVNVLSLWTILMVTNFHTMSWVGAAIYLAACCVIIGYEFTIGVVRVQDFFRAYYLREFKKIDSTSNKASTAAVMEGKLKEKLESIGIACLCLAQAWDVSVTSYAGIAGVTCLLLSVRLAHASLMNKLKARAALSRSHTDACEDEVKAQTTAVPRDPMGVPTMRTIGVQVDLGELQLKESRKEEDMKRTPSDLFGMDRQEAKLLHSISIPESIDNRVDRVLTVGCFDLFHYGHVVLFQRMRALGKQVIVGVHDSRSIYVLKKRVPMDSTEKRMRAVKQYADVVFCVAGTDPTLFLDCVFERKDDTALYVRGDDMKNFPARELCERLMTVKFLPYTQGVSSTKLRKDLLNSNEVPEPRLEDLESSY